ncbi:hypothetical protein EC973_008254 [Apophysomyces ossiformis]|uniref:Chloride channel protein n=1 Tax=Apophysomyces ossiformis TaxID=679940 RepID=A0A8H7ET84_9FUNG|nr:hypothetical protein EC973_008254 [Apophysomyces ossiformis]
MTERSNLLDRRRSNQNYHTLPHLPSIQSLDQYSTFLYPSNNSTPLVSPRTEHRFKLFNKRTGVYDEDRKGLVKENTGVRVWSESYSSIDWIHDRIKEGLRLRKLRDQTGWRGRLENAKDASQAWIIVIITGVIVAGTAWFIDISQEWMTDLKQGYCTTKWTYNRNFCCWAWRTWPEVFGVQNANGSYYTALFMYTLFGLLFSLVAALMVKYSAEKVVIRTPESRPKPFSKSPSFASITAIAAEQTLEGNISKPEVNETQTKSQTKMAYYSAGSGIPEVKVILSGFVIKRYLGLKNYLVKSIGMIFSVSAGLIVGKEGPFVHLACSVANIVCRFFPKYNKNESKQREMLSAAAAAGVTVAFGAPIGGVIFSLEEVSYYFSIKTMVRSFCAAMVAAAVLKISNPFGTGKIVLFQVQYDKEYHLFEMVPFLICGALAGFLGAFMTYFNIKYQHLRRSSFFGKYPVLEVIAIMFVTSLACFWNPFTRLSMNELAANLFSECSPTNDNAGLCAQSMSQIPQLLYLLMAALLTIMCLMVVTFGCRAPGGPFMPGLIIGALLGRIIGLIMQYLTTTYSDVWPFTVCAEDLETRGSCVIPGVYAMVGAASSLAGVTKATVSMVVIMFELTYSLVYAVPIMSAVMVAKWTANAMYEEGIDDLLIELQGYPFLDCRKEYAHTMTVLDLTEYLPTIKLEEHNTVSSLHRKLQAISSIGYGEDGGFPILSHGNILDGYIATSELAHALSLMSATADDSHSLPDGRDVDDIPVHFRKIGQHHTDGMEESYLIPNRDECEEGTVTPSNDLSQYVDQAPLTINQNASMELLMEIFIKLGARYVCVTHSNGRFLGIIHKRRLLAYLKDLDEH